MCRWAVALSQVWPSSIFGSAAAEAHYFAASTLGMCSGYLKVLAARAEHDALLQQQQQQQHELSPAQQLPLGLGSAAALAIRTAAVLMQDLATHLPDTQQPNSKTAANALQSRNEDMLHPSSNWEDELLHLSTVLSAVHGSNLVQQLIVPTRLQQGRAAQGCSDPDGQETSAQQSQATSGSSSCGGGCGNRGLADVAEGVLLFRADRLTALQQQQQQQVPLDSQIIAAWAKICQQPLAWLGLQDILSRPIDAAALTAGTWLDWCGQDCAATSRSSATSSSSSRLSVSHTGDINPVLGERWGHATASAAIGALRVKLLSQGLLCPAQDGKPYLHAPQALLAAAMAALRLRGSNGLPLAAPHLSTVLHLLSSCPHPGVMQGPQTQRTPYSSPNLQARFRHQQDLQRVPCSACIEARAPATWQCLGLAVQVTQQLLRLLDAPHLEAASAAAKMGSEMVQRLSGEGGLPPPAAEMLSSMHFDLRRAAEASDALTDVLQIVQQLTAEAAHLSTVQGDHSSQQLEQLAFAVRWQRQLCV